MSFARIDAPPSWLGRNEEGGLRCIYHGWKFDVDGNCVEQMNEPEQFNTKIKATAYQTFEQGGVIWTFMGPPDITPPAPEFDTRPSMRGAALSQRSSKSATGFRLSRAASTRLMHLSCTAPSVTSRRHSF